MLEKILKWMIYGLPWAVMLYLVRFQIGPLPTTGLEVYVGGMVLIYVLTRNLTLALSSDASIGTSFSRFVRRGNVFTKLVLAWLVVTLIAVFVSPSLRTGFGLWRAYVLEPILVMIVVITTLKTEQEWATLRTSMFATVPFLAIWSVIQFLTGWGIPHPWNVAIAAGRRAVGVFPYPNALSLFVTPIGAWAAGMLVNNLFGPGASRGNFARTMFVVVTVSTLICLLLAKSEGGFMGFFAAVFVMLMLWRKTRVWTLGVTALGLIAAFAIPMIRVPFVRELSFQGWSGRVRVWMWQDTWRMLKDHWFFGAGFGGYPSVYAAYRTKTFIEIFQYPHTILFNFWSETGLAGVIVFAMMAVTWIKKCLQRFQLSRQQMDLAYVSLLAPIVAILVQGLVDVPYFKNDLALIFFLMMAFVMRRKIVGGHEGNM